MHRALLPIAILSLLSSSALAADELQVRAEVNWRYGDERSIMMSEIWVPVAQDENSVLYADLRIMGDNQDNYEGNLGLGYRTLTSAPVLGESVAGVHGWIDRRITSRGSKFYQATIGAEWLGEELDIRLNGYVPLSDKKSHSIPNADSQTPALSGTGIVVDTNGILIEEPQHGFDLELGWEMGAYSKTIRENTDSLRLYAGGYYFNSDNTERTTGWRTRITADVTSNIQFGARFQKDDERGSQGFLEATFRFPYNKKKSYRREGLRARLDEAPERDIDIVTGSAITDTGDRIPLVKTETGATVEVLNVDNTAAGGGDGSVETPFNTLAAAQAAASQDTIIYVHAGDGTSTGQDQGITLNKDGQQLIGSGTDFVMDTSKFSAANGQIPTSGLIAEASSAPILSNIMANGDGVTVMADDVTISGITVSGANRDGIVVEANGAAASATNVTIENVTTQNNRIGIYVHGTNSGVVSAKVQGAATLSNSQHGIAVYDDTDGGFEVDLGGGPLGSGGNNILAGNTLEDLAVEYDGRSLSAKNNWWGQASGPDTDDPSDGTAPQIYYGPPINDGLAGHWTFDTEWTTNTTAYDRSGNGNNGALQGGLSLADQVAGENGEALDFDGINDFVVVPNMDLSGTAAISAVLWRYNSNFTPLSIALEMSSSYNASSTGFLYIPSSNAACSGKLGVALQGDVGYNISCFQRPTTPAWHQYVPVFDKNQDSTNEVDISIDGISATFINQTASADNTNNFGVNSLYMMSRNGTSYFEDELLDDVRIYDRALSASEIAELYRMNTSSSVNTSTFLTAAP